MRRPLVWASVALAAGIAGASYLSLPAWGIVGFGFAAAGVAAALVCRSTVAGSLALVVLAAAVGAALHAHAARPVGPDDAASLVGLRATVEGIVAATDERVVVHVERAREFPQVRRGRLQVVTRGGAEVRVGDRVRATGRVAELPAPRNPGEPDPARRLARYKVRARLYAERVEIVEPAAGYPVLRAAAAARRALRSVYEEVLPPPYGALLSGLVLGIPLSDPDLNRAFRDAGLLHVLVASGAQLAIVAGALHLVLRGMRRWVRSAATLAGVLAFALVCGWEPSMARASAMAVLAVAASGWRREGDGYTSLALAGAVLLVANPALLWDLGFQLSFAATWGLIHLAPPIAERLARLPGSVRTTVAATAGANLAVMPILVWNFQQIQPHALLGNLLALPVVAAVVPLGIAAGVVGAVWAPLALPLAWIAEPACAYLVRVAMLVSGLPGATVPVPRPAPWAVAAAVAGLALAGRALRGGPRPHRAVVFAALVVAGCVWSHALPGRDATLEVTFLDVGQGDAIWVEAPGGRTILIDGGPDGRQVVPFLRRRARQVDLVVLSHPHADHVGGVVSVLQNFEVGAVLDAGYPHPTPVYRDFLLEVESRRIPYRVARRGMTVELGRGVTAHVLWPLRPFVGGRSAANENSVVLRLVYGEVAFLFAGDVEEVAEGALVVMGEAIRSRVLKVPHQGSRTSSSEAFLDAVRPEVAVLSVGKGNRYGHPHPDVLARYARRNVALYRTDRDGAVAVTTDGRGVWVRTMRAR
ncbi:MAG: DNA internalization-related competence protein ComEC/Rec2 [Armatimonadota bacterium]|nr:DNA internalization-related competence protein ComEC/Rec2 [Armatimonadota bacterium]MDR5697963.1 DNA internalization-related competence protein ComEC/Rec2 [Armatimonadota bacterium]